MPLHAIPPVLVVLTICAWSVVAVPAAATPSQNDPRVIELPTSIDATGTDDVSAELNDFFARVPPNVTVAFPQNGRFRAESTVLLSERDGLTIEGNGSTIFATTQGGLKRSHVSLSGGWNITIRRLRVEGANPKAGSPLGAYVPEFEGQHGFAIRGTDGVELDSVEVYDVHGDFVYLGRVQEDGRWTERAWIHNSNFDRNGRQGIAIVAGRDVVIERNVIREVARSTIDLEPNNERGGAINVHVLNNEIGPGRLLFLAAAGNGPVDLVVMAGNQMLGRSLTFTILPPEGARREGFWIVDNEGIEAPNRTPINVTRVDGLVVLRNSQMVREGEVGVQANEVCSMLVSDNDFGPVAPDVGQKGSPCGDPPNPTPPAPPDVFNRPTAEDMAAAMRSTTTTPVRPTAIADAAPDPELPTSWTLTIVMGVLASATITGAAITSRRSRSRSRS